MVPRKRSAPSPIADEASTPKDAQGKIGAASGRKKTRLNEEDASEQGNVLAIADDVAARMVTPATVKPGHTDVEAPLEEVRRGLFREGGAVAITPLRAEKPKAVEAKRKLIFGRSVVEIEVKDNVREVYAIVKKLTGSIGGNGSFGPIYGELTMGSMQKMVNLMKEHTGLDSSSRFIDVGSGIGKPSLHVTQDPGVDFSYGIEVEADRWLLGMNCLKGMLDAASEQPCDASEDEKIHHRCMFVHGDITKARSFDPFTHVYMFSIGFPPALWCELSEKWNRSSSPYFICYHGPKDIINSYEFDAELIVQTSTSMHGSKEGHTGYIYRRTGNRFKTSAGAPVCDPLFAETWGMVQNGFESLKQHVDSTVEEKMKSGPSTRSRRRR
jgi:Histone methylation protein DOT1